MKYIRQVELDLFPKVERHREIVADCETGIESCAISVNRLPPDEEPHANLHGNPVDTLYFAITGEMSVRFGDQTRCVEPNSVVHIPAHLPYAHWNAGRDDEVHLEVLVPSPTSSRCSSTRIHKDAGSVIDTPIAPGTVRKIDTSAFGKTGKFTSSWVANRANGSDHIQMYLGEIPPGAHGPGLHIHPFDQFYYVLEGTLSVEIGMKTYSVGTHTLVVLPEGVPHRQWNSGDVPVRQLTLIVPEPPAGTTRDVPVDIRSGKEATI